MNRNGINMKAVTPTSTASECSIPSEKAPIRRRPTPDIPRLKIGEGINHSQTKQATNPNKSFPNLGAVAEPKVKQDVHCKEDFLNNNRPKSNPSGHVPKRFPEVLKKNSYNFIDPVKPNENNDNVNKIEVKPTEIKPVTDIISDQIVPPNNSMNNRESPNIDKEPTPQYEDAHMQESGLSLPRHPSFAYPKSALMHLEKLKQRIGMNTHVAHYRLPRDIPCTSKDMDLAIDATRLLEMTHQRMRQRFTRRPHSVDQNRSSSHVDSMQSESFAVNFDNDKFLLNNPIFQTFWERIFIKKESMIPSGKQSYMLGQTSDQERLKSKFCFNNGQGFFYGDPEHQQNYSDPVWMQARNEYVRIVEPGNSPIIEFPMEKRCRLGTPIYNAKKKGKASLNSSLRVPEPESAFNHTQAATGWKGTQNKMTGGVKFNILDEPTPTKQTLVTSSIKTPSTQYNKSNAMENYNYAKERFESPLKRELMRKVHCFQIKQPRFTRLEQLLTENFSSDMPVHTSTSNVVRVF